MALLVKFLYWFLLLKLTSQVISVFFNDCLDGMRVVTAAEVYDVPLPSRERRLQRRRWHCKGRFRPLKKFEKFGIFSKLSKLSNFPRSTMWK